MSFIRDPSSVSSYLVRCIPSLSVNAIPSSKRTTMGPQPSGPSQRTLAHSSLYAASSVSGPKPEVDEITWRAGRPARRPLSRGEVGEHDLQRPLASGPAVRPTAAVAPRPCRGTRQSVVSLLQPRSRRDGEGGMQSHICQNCRIISSPRSPQGDQKGMTVELVHL